MKLNVFERAQILQILPKEGDFTILKVLRELQGLVGFSDEDHKEFNIRSNGATVSWGPSEEKNNKGKRLFSDEENKKFSEAVVEEREIKFGDKALEIIKNELLKLDKDKKLTPAMFTVYEKFVQEKEGK